MKYWLIIQNDHLIVEKDATQLSPFLNESLVSNIKPFLLRQHRIGQWNHQAVYSAELPSTCEIPIEYQSISLRTAVELFQTEWYRLIAKAYFIMQWDKNHHYCGHCGNITKQSEGVFEKICTACQLTFYPRISPTIIVLIQKDDYLLMARSPHFKSGVYALIAGFVEPGENIEEAIYREVDEEVGIQIKNLRYFGSQPWPFPDSLMIGFIADYASGELTIDHREIEEAGWYRYDNLPGRPSFSISIASQLIDDFVEKHNGNRNSDLLKKRS